MPNRGERKQKQEGTKKWGTMQERSICSYFVKVKICTKRWWPQGEGYSSQNVLFLHFNFFTTCIRMTECLKEVFCSIHVFKNCLTQEVGVKFLQDHWARWGWLCFVDKTSFIQHLKRRVRVLKWGLPFQTEALKICFLGFLWMTSCQGCWNTSTTKTLRILFLFIIGCTNLTGGHIAKTLTAKVRTI